MSSLSCIALLCAILAPVLDELGVCDMCERGCSAGSKGSVVSGLAWVVAILAACGGFAVFALNALRAGTCG